MQDGYEFLATLKWKDSYTCRHRNESVYIKGTPKAKEQSRSKSDKKVRVVIAFQHRDGKSRRVYAKVIQDYSTAFLKFILVNHIKYNANVLADGWSGYKLLKENYLNLKQTLSDKEKNFKMLHIQIRNFELAQKCTLVLQ